MTGLRRYGNSFGQSPRNRAKWTQGLPFKIKDARKEPVEYLWFVGDYASFDPRLVGDRRAPPPGCSRRRAWISAFSTKREQNSGNDVRRSGEEGLFEMLRDKNLTGARKGAVSRRSSPPTHTATTRSRTSTDGRPRWCTAAELVDELLRAGKLAAGRTSRRGSGHLPRPLLPGPLQRRLRRAAASARIDRRRGSSRCRAIARTPGAAAPAAVASGWKMSRA